MVYSNEIVLESRIWPIKALKPATFPLELQTAHQLVLIKETKYDILLQKFPELQLKEN